LVPFGSARFKGIRMPTTALPEPHRTRAHAIAARLRDLPQVVAVTLAGSLAADLTDAYSDLDIYVYASTPIPAEARIAIAREFAGENDPSIEIDKPFWGPEDAWTDRASGLGVDVIYWSPEWIEDQLDRVLVRHEARLGYSTSFWNTVRLSRPLYDRDGWFAGLQVRAGQPYPEALGRAIVALNHPVLRQIGSSYVHQIELAIQRQDRVSVNHRITAFLASYFDILFAVNRVPNPGEKRLIVQVERLCATLPEDMARHVDALVCGIAAPWGEQSTLPILDRMLDNLDELLEGEGLLPLPVE
jgi:predicted nucleotidyltransferase